MYDLYIKFFTNCILVTPIFYPKGKRAIQTFICSLYTDDKIIYNRLSKIKDLGNISELKYCRHKYKSYFNVPYKLK